MALRYGYVHGCVRALLNHCDYARAHHRHRRDCDQGSTDDLKLWSVSQNIGVPHNIGVCDVPSVDDGGSLTMAVHLAASLK